TIGTGDVAPVPIGQPRSARHLAHEVALAELDAVMAQDVVSGRGVEIEVRQSVVIEEDPGFERAIVRAELHGDAALFFPVDLRGVEALQEVDGGRNPRLQIGDVAAFLEVGQLRAGDPAGASACAVACWTWRTKGNMSGANRSCSS